MDVDVDVLGRNGQGEKEAGPISGSDRRSIAGFGGPDQERIAEWPAVDEELGSAAGGTGVTGALDQSFDPDAADPVLDRDQGRGEVATPDRGQPLGLGLARGDLQPDQPIDHQLESDRGVSGGQDPDRVPGGPSFARDRAEKLPAGGGIEEEAPNGDGG